jgi:hypothetical protein
VPAKSSPAKRKTSHITTTKATVSPPSSVNASVVPPPPEKAQNLNRKKRILILGDSITKGLVGWRMSRRHTILNRSTSGTNLEQWIRLAPIFIEEEQTDILIFHCGTNNIDKLYTDHAISLMEQLINCALNVKPDLLIGISTLTAQRDIGHQEWIYYRLRNICITRNFLYMS